MSTFTKGNTFLEALRYAESRGVRLPDEYYGKLVGIQRSQTVSVAGLAGLDQIKFVIDQVSKVIREGGSFESFKKAVADSTLDIDLPRHRLDNIFRTNMQAAYNRGRWEQQSRVRSTRPYLMYDAINDSRTRPNHLAMDNVVLRWDDPWWQTHYPPNGYRCRCTTISLTEAQAKRRGITEAPPEEDPDSGWDYNPGADYSGPVSRKAEATGYLSPTQQANRQALVDKLFGLGDAEVLKAIRKRLPQAPDGLSARTLQLLVAYTSGQHTAINQLLRYGDPGERAGVMTELGRIFTNGRATIPAKAGTLWRGASIDLVHVERFLEQHQPGTILTPKGFLSATRDQAVAEGLAVSGKPTTKKLVYKLKYDGKSGLEVGALAGGADEKGVLVFPDMASYKVVKVTDTVDEVIVHLEPSTGTGADFQY